MSAMPLIDLHDLIDPDSIEEQLFAKFAEHMHVAAEATVTRSGRVRRGESRFARAVQIQLADDDDPPKLCAELCKRLVAAAEEDCGDSRATYHFALWSEADDKHKPKQLAQAKFTLGDDDDDGPASTSTLRASATLLKDVGERNLRLLDNSIGMVERILPIADAHNHTNAEITKAEAEARLALRRLDYEVAREREKEAADERTSTLIWTTVQDVAKQYHGVISMLVEGLRDKWTGKDGAK